jgi:hypothetical protein
MLHPHARRCIASLCWLGCEVDPVLRTTGIDGKWDRDLHSPGRRKLERIEQKHRPAPVTDDRTRQPLHGRRSRTADDIESAYP